MTVKRLPKTPSAQAAACAVLSGFIYLALFTWPFPLAKFYTTIPPVDYAKLTNHSPLGLLLYVGGIGLLFWLYGQAIRLSRTFVSGHILWPASVFLALISLFAYPLTAIDLFIYALRTRGWALYGLNPLATAPELLPKTDPWLGLAAEWLEAASPYGPLWEWLSLGVFYLSGGGFLANLFGLKLLMALFYLACAGLIYHILRQTQPAWAVAGTMAFAWSPLVFFESGQNAHNDIIMVFFLLAAVWVWGQWVKSAGPAHRFQATFFALMVSVCLALSILVKFVTVLVTPFFLLSLAAGQPTWPRRVLVLFAHSLLIAVCILLAMRPLWPGWAHWAVLEAGSGAGRSLLALLILGLRGWLGTNLAFDVSRNLLLGLFGLIYLYYLGSMVHSRPPTADRRPPTITEYQSTFQSSSPSASPTAIPPAPPSPSLPTSQPSPLSPAFAVLFWYVLLAAPVFHAWYLLWFAPLAVLVWPDRRPLIATTVFSITALLAIPYFETIRVWFPLLLQNHFLGHLIGVPLLIGPPALAMLWPISRSRGSEV